MRMIFLFFFIVALAAVLTGSCAVLDVVNATPLPAPTTAPPTLTPTIVWFPPSATPTLRAASTSKPPTPEMRPGVGSIFLTDDFSNPLLWNTAASERGSAQVNENRLILAAQGKTYLFSLRQNLNVGDYYAEITARPALCRDDDSYGALIRASAAAYYRFALTCSGNALAERVSVGKREVLQQPLPSGDAPRGAPGEVRIGIWASGSKMRLFLNGRFQFGIQNSNYPSGTVGVFVNAAGDTPLVVSFSRLTLQKLDDTPPTAAPAP